MILFVGKRLISGINRLVIHQDPNLDIKANFDGCRIAVIRETKRISLLVLYVTVYSFLVGNRVWTNRSITSANLVGTVASIIAGAELNRVIDRRSKTNLGVGFDAMSSAVARGHNEVIRVLIDYGGIVLKERINPVPSSNKTILNIAARWSQHHTMRLLLKEGGGITEIGEQALHEYAVKREDLLMTRLLIDAGVSTCDNPNKSHQPVLIAKRHGWQHIVDLLISAGADDINLFDPDKCPIDSRIFRDSLYPLKKKRHRGNYGTYKANIDFMQRENFVDCNAQSNKPKECFSWKCLVQLSLMPNFI
ncbi:hypothetical protein BPAE_0005g00410 [Botrytis paeoniae]|uniref:Uncharacterized protein n=1 Tax=Botrytis paeoniae TaxID=278948 RepID=A0A4Z1G0C4_9HELO|nr:hypothetical protein BPAE_0005g00410 [Botrytis paeoniae]